MGIVRFDPVRGFETIARRMGDLASEFEKGMSFEYGSFTPRVDIIEDEKSFYVQVELPGILKDDVKLSVNEDNVLLIKGTKKREAKDENKDLSFVRVERSYGEFTRSFTLPENVNRESVKAKFENGLLNVTIDKVEPVKPKEVEINIS